MNTEQQSELIDYLRLAIAQGFDAPEEMIRNAREVCFEGAESQELEQEIAAVLLDLTAEHARQAAAWPAMTDCDRLDAAFEELNSKGIMARHNWTCCGTCGAAEMPEEFERLEGEWEGTPIVGYAFYHQQNTEGAADGSCLYLGYGSTVGAESEAMYESQCLEVAHTVCDVLRSHGLPVNWDGTYSKRIAVPLDWKRRGRPARFCEGDQ